MTEVEQSGRRIVTPPEAQEWLQESEICTASDLAYTVATEPDRILAAVVKELREFGEYVARVRPIDLDDVTIERVRREAIDRADEIENGAPL